MLLIWLKQAQPCPDRSGNGQSQDGVGNQDTSEKEQPCRRAERDAGVESGRFPKSPAPETISYPAQQHYRERMRKPGRPVMDAENLICNRHHPVVEWRLFQIGNTVEARGYPVSRREHGASGLRLDGVDVVHEARRATNTYKKNQAGDCDDNPI